MSRKRRWLTGLGVMLGAVVLVVMSMALRPLSYADALIRFSLWRGGAQSKYVTVNGLRLHYFEAAAAGGDRGTPLLLVHGLGARGEDFGKLIPALAAAGFPL